MRLQELNNYTLRVELKDNPDAVISRVKADIAASETALAQAGQNLDEATAQREAGFQKLSEYNKEFKLVSGALRNSKQLALAGDIKTAWKEADRNRSRRQELSDLIAYQTLWLSPAEEVAVKLAEIEVEVAKNDWQENNVCLDRCRIFSLSIHARSIDPGAEISLESASSAKLMKVVERSRRDLIPAMEHDLQVLKERMNDSRAEAASSIFG